MRRRAAHKRRGPNWPWLLEQGLHRRSRANLLKVAVDDAIAFRDPVEDRYEAAVDGAQGYQTLIRLVFRPRRAARRSR